MQEEVIDGIVINVQDYKDSAKLLTLLTPNGKRLINAKGVSKQASKLKGVAYPFCFAEFSLLTKNQTTLVGYNLYDSFFNLSANYMRYVTACAIVDLINKTTDDAQALKELFLPCVNAVKNLCYQNEISHLAILNNFLLTYLNVCGYALNLNTCAGCGKELKEFYFNPYDASILCENCKTIRCEQLNNSQTNYIFNKAQTKIDKIEEQHITKNLANAIFCLTNIKLKIEELIK